MNVSQPDDHEVSQEELLQAITIRVTDHLYMAMSVNTGVDSITKLSVLNVAKKPVSCTDLDSHVNMPVVGTHSTIVSDTGRIADVSPYTPHYKSMQVKIVDAVVRYECLYTGHECTLIIQNALHVPSMANN